jgi:hypothetical protein
VEFGRYRGIADSDKPSTAVTERHGRRFFCKIFLKSFWAKAGWRSTVPPSCEAGRSAPTPAPARRWRLDHLYWLTRLNRTPLIASAAELPFSHRLAARGYSSRQPVRVGRIFLLKSVGHHWRRRFRSVDGRPCLWLGKGAAEVLGGPLVQGDCPAPRLRTSAGFTRGIRRWPQRRSTRPGGRSLGRARSFRFSH